MYQWLAATLGDQSAWIASIVITVVAVLLVLFILRAVWRALRGGTYITGGKDRRQRLAVMDAAPVDSHRKLVLVRRDDVEHLILIGGVNDLLVEGGIGVSKRTASAESEADVAAPMDATPTIAAGAIAGGVLSTQQVGSQTVAQEQISPAAPIDEAVQHTPDMVSDALDAAPDVFVQENQIDPVAPEPAVFAQVKTPEVPDTQLAENSAVYEAQNEVGDLDLPVELAADDLALDVVTPEPAAAEQSVPSIDKNSADSIEDEMEDLLNQLTGSAKR